MADTGVNASIYNMPQPDPLGTLRRFQELGQGAATIGQTKASTTQLGAETTQTGVNTAGSQQDINIKAYNAGGSFLGSMVAQGVTDPIALSTRLGDLAQTGIIPANVHRQMLNALHAAGDQGPAAVMALVNGWQAAGLSPMPSTPALSPGGSQILLAPQRTVATAGLPPPAPLPGAPGSSGPGVGSPPVGYASDTLGVKLPAGADAMMWQKSDIPPGAVVTRYSPQIEAAVKQAMDAAANKPFTMQRRNLMSQATGLIDLYDIHGKDTTGAVYDALSNISSLFNIDTSGMQADQQIHKILSNIQSSTDGKAFGGTDMALMKNIENNPNDTMDKHVLHVILAKMQGVEDMKNAEANFYQALINRNLSQEQIKNAVAVWQKYGSDPRVYEINRLDQLGDPYKADSTRLYKETKDENPTLLNQRIDFLHQNNPDGIPP